MRSRYSISTLNDFKQHYRCERFVLAHLLRYGRVSLSDDRYGPSLTHALEDELEPHMRAATRGGVFGGILSTLREVTWALSKAEIIETLPERRSKTVGPALFSAKDKHLALYTRMRNHRMARDYH